MTGATVHVQQVYIKAKPQAIWDAITDPEWNRRYGYRVPSEYELRPGGAYRVHASAEMQEYGSPEVTIDGEIIEVDPPHKLVQTWHAMFNPDTAAEPANRLTWEIEEGNGGVSKLTVTHELTDAPKTAAFVTGQIPEAGGGWSFILSELKTLLETGSTFEG